MNHFQMRLKAQAAKRRAKMKELRDQGLTLEAIGKRFRITRERVRQILSK